MAIGRLLLIAPQSDLRRSLVFALEAEGYQVSSAAQIPAGPVPGDVTYDCTIVDQKALIGPPEDIVQFCSKAGPVVLLSETPVPWLSQWVVEVVDKPTLGSSLSRAVKHALRQGA